MRVYFWFCAPFKASVSPCATASPSLHSSFPRSLLEKTTRAVCYLGLTCLRKSHLPLHTCFALETVDPVLLYSGFECYCEEIGRRRLLLCACAFSACIFSSSLSFLVLITVICFLWDRICPFILLSHIYFRKVLLEF